MHAHTPHKDIWDGLLFHFLLLLALVLVVLSAYGEKWGSSRPLGDPGRSSGTRPSPTPVLSPAQPHPYISSCPNSPKLPFPWLQTQHPSPSALDQHSEGPSAQAGVVL